MRKRILSLVLAMAILCAFAPIIHAAEIVDSGTCGSDEDGNNVTWTLDSDGTLTISGEGNMRDYLTSDLTDMPDMPWYSQISNINSVVIENGVTSIGSRAFCNCSNLTNIIIPDSITSIGDGAFWDCNLTEIIIPESVKSIGNHAFAAFQVSADTIKIPKSVTFIGNSAFLLQEANIEVDPNNEYYSSEDGILFNKDKTILLYYPRKSADLYVVPDSVIEIRDFLNFSKVENIFIPDTVTKINDFFSNGYFWCYVTMDKIKLWCHESFSEVQADFYGDYTFDKYGIEIKYIENCGDSLTWYLNSNGMLIISGSGDMYDYDDAGDAPWYRFYSYIKSISISSGVTGIGKNAINLSSCRSDIYYDGSIEDFFNINIKQLFSDTDRCTVHCGDEIFTIGTCGDNLTWTLDDEGTLTISGSGDMYDYYSSGIPWYSKKNNIKRVLIGNSVTSIGTCSFNYCRNLTAIELPNSVISIGNYAFNGCTNLTEITIPDSVASIGNSAFSDCQALTNIIIPDNVASIGDFAFENCKSLTNITIPDSVTSIGEGAFWNCRNLTAIELPNSVTSIDDRAFMDCENLTDITLPGSVVSIGNSAFYGCGSLTSVTIPDSVTSIGNSAFSDCQALTNIIIPDNVASIGDFAFENCKSLTNITIPDSVTNIGEGAFAYSGITDALVGSGIEFIDEAAFSLSFSLEKIVINKNNNFYTTEDGILFNKDKTEIITYPSAKSDTEYSIPYGVKNICNEAFNSCCNLINVYIPDSVTNIGYASFCACTGLISVSIPKCVTSIYADTFTACESLTTVTFPNSITNIDDWAFYDCESITDVYYAGSEDEWNDIEIGEYNESLTEARIYFSRADNNPSATDTVAPTTIPTETPTEAPTLAPTTAPTAAPTEVPTAAPTEAPTSAPTSIPSQSPAEPVAQIGQYADKVEISKEITDNGEVVFTVTPLDGTQLSISELTLFAAEYDADGKLISVHLGENILTDGVLTITADLPETDRYKFMLWDKANCPLINVITDIY